MSAGAFLTSLDLAMRIRIWNKFKDDMGLTDMDTGSAIQPKSVSFRKIAEKRGKVEMEFITVHRSTTAFDWKRNSSFASRRGFEFVSPDSSVTKIKAVPATLGYNVWFWSKDKDKINTVAEKFLFWQQQDPNLDLYLNGTYPLELDLGFGEVIDESEVDDQYDKGAYFVIRCPFYIQAWLFDIIDQTGNNIIKTIFLKGYDNSQEYDVEVFSDTIRGKNPYDSGGFEETVTVS